MKFYTKYRTIRPACGTAINQNNPITYKLAACQPFNEYSGNPVEIIEQKISSVDWGDGYWYITGIYAGGNTTIDTGNIIAPRLGNFTFLFRGFDIIYDSVLLCSCNNYGEAGFTMVSNSSNGYVQVRVNDDAMQYETGLELSTFTEKSQIVGVIDGKTSSDRVLKLYIDGIYKNQVTLTGMTDIYNTTGLKIGTRNYNYGMTGIISEVMLQTRALNDNEIQSMYDNPNQIYEEDIYYTYKTNNQQIITPRIFYDKFDRNNIYDFDVYDTTSDLYTQTEEGQP